MTFVSIKIELEDGGVITARLLPEVAPRTVENFLNLVDKGFYDGLTFHRVIPNFMIQGGDPNGNGTGGSGTNIIGEFAENNIFNPISHQRRVISMARASDPNSASSQFFICQADCAFLDGKYAAFGFVVDGLESVDKIANVERDANDKPLEPVVIKKISII